MPIEYVCPGCNQPYRVPDTAAGREALCRYCGGALQVPGMTPDEPGFSAAPLADADVPATTLPLAKALPQGQPSGAAPPIGKPVVRQPGNPAAAVLPAQLDVDLRQYLRCYPARPLAWAAAIVGLLAATLALGVVGHLLAACVAAAGCLLLAWYGHVWTLGIRAKFAHGDLCPAIVVSDDPWRVVVFTDLSTGGTRDHPAIKILAQPLGRLGGGNRPQLADRLVAVASYAGKIAARAGSRETPYWQDFRPDVVQCGVTDAAALARTMTRIPDNSWRQMHYYISKLSSESPGLYRMWETTADRQSQHGGK